MDDTELIGNRTSSKQSENPDPSRNGEEPGNKYKRPPVQKLSLNELCDRFPTLAPHVVEGLFREGETCNVIAPSKLGKSWGVYGLGISVVTGWDWLGRFPVSQGRVLLIDNELHPATLANRIPKVGAAIGESRGEFLSVADYGNQFDIWTLRGNLRSLLDLRSEFDKIEPNYYKMIIFDAKYRFAVDGVSENDNAADTAVYNLLDQYAAKLNAALVLVHHSSKGAQSDKRVTDVGSGAGAQSRAADCHLVLREHEEAGAVVLEAAVRSFPPVEPLSLRWEFPLWVPDETIDPQELKGRKSKHETDKAEKDEADFSKIIKTLEAKGPLTCKLLITETGISRDRLNGLLGKLTYTKRIANRSVKKRGNPTSEYYIPSE